MKKIILLLLCCFIVGCQNKSEQGVKSNYSQITDVQGITFQVPSSVSTKATALSQIVDSSDYEFNSIYSYKNGTDTYILFCMKELIILANSGTNFNFQANENKEKCLESNELLNTWFSVPGNKLDYEEQKKDSYYKIIANVNAEVVITSNLYGDYTGKLAVINNGQNEWTLFVGSVSSTGEELSNAQNQFINNIVLSMTLNNEKKEEKQYEIIVEETKLEPQEETIVQPNVIPSTNNDVITEEKKGINITNLNQEKLDVHKVYNSDEYNMLYLGQAGYFTCNFMDEGEKLVVRANKVYTGEEADTIIKNYVKKQNIYEYFEAPDGYSWHVLEYDISYENCSTLPYINFKLKGLDGNKLVFRGIPIDERTHDAVILPKEKRLCTYNNYCYYAVPNGCHEYAIMCGDENGICTYYYISL